MPSIADDGVELEEAPHVGPLARRQELGVDDPGVKEGEPVGEPGADGALDDAAGTIEVAGIRARPQASMRGRLSAHLLDVLGIIDAHEVDTPHLGLRPHQGRRMPGRVSIGLIVGADDRSAGGGRRCPDDIAGRMEGPNHVSRGARP